MLYSYTTEARAVIDLHFLQKVFNSWTNLAVRVCRGMTHCVTNEKHWDLVESKHNMAAFLNHMVS